MHRSSLIFFLRTDWRHALLVLRKPHMPLHRITERGPVISGHGGYTVHRRGKFWKKRLIVAEPTTGTDNFVRG